MAAVHYPPNTPVRHPRRGVLIRSSIVCHYVKFPRAKFGTARDSPLELVGFAAYELVYGEAEQQCCRERPSADKQGPREAATARICEPPAGCAHNYPEDEEHRSPDTPRCRWWAPRLRSWAARWRRTSHHAHLDVPPFADGVDAQGCLPLRELFGIWKSLNCELRHIYLRPAQVSAVGRIFIVVLLRLPTCSRFSPRFHRGLNLLCRSPRERKLWRQVAAFTGQSVAQRGGSRCVSS
jgi:hypothetical protein